MAPNIQTFINSFQNRLELPVRQHLKNVYGTLMMTCASASVGVYVDMYTKFQAGLLSTIIGVGLMLMLISTPDNGKNTKQRLGYLLGFGLTSGMSTGPLLQYASIIDPSIIVTALLGTTLVFVCFSIAAMLADRGSWLFLGGTLMTLLTSMSLMTLVNIFMQSHFLYQAHIYLGLMLMCGFVLYDTQLIIEKRRMGSKDFVQHAMELFIDFIGIFRRLVIILTQKKWDDSMFMQWQIVMQPHKAPHNPEWRRGVVLEFPERFYGVLAGAEAPERHRARGYNYKGR